MMTIQSLSEQDLPNKMQFVATVHSSLGSAYLEMGQTEQSIEHFTKDMEIAEEE